MKYLFVLVLSLNSFANCNIFIENETVDYIGYDLNISQANYNLLSDKNFQRVFDNTNTYSLSVDAYQVEGRRFNKAQAKLVILKDNSSYYELVVNKTCFTLNCSVSAVANTINKLFVKARKKLKSCI